MPQLRAQVRRVDSNLVVSDMRTLDGQLNLLLANERMLSLLSVSFAVLATLLAATGLYGVLSFMVARRNREIGIRMALGAYRSRVIRLVMREMVLLILAGLASGVVASMLLGRFVANQLYEVKPSDPASF
jgi:putative ABC transport system permease protein